MLNMRALLVATLCFGAALSFAAESADELVQRAVEAAGGKDKLPTLFRIKEVFHFGDKPEPPEGKKRSTRVSVLEAPKYWWIGGKDRDGEPAKFDVWAWTLVALLDEGTKKEVITDVTENERPAFGLRLTGAIDPQMDIYFDRQTGALVRMDWRGDIYRYTEIREQAGFKYPAKCIIYKAAGGKPWFYHEITELEHLTELPAGIKRE